nr:hypothetical protein [Tanacetum cinerariifolium]
PQVGILCWVRWKRVVGIMWSSGVGLEWREGGAEQLAGKAGKAATVTPI